jgi:hypothetical protein
LLIEGTVSLSRCKSEGLRNMAKDITRELIRQEKKTWHVFSSAGSWVVKRGGTRRATRVFSSQAEAIDLARSLAREAGGEFVLHRKDGRMQEHEIVRNGDLEKVYVYSADARRSRE